MTELPYKWYHHHVTFRQRRTEIGMQENSGHIIHVGTAGWSYPDWEGIVYPRHRPANFDPLEYLSRYFDTVEINSSFYSPPAKKISESWVQRVEHNPSFRFTAKLYKKFTLERESASGEDVRLFKEGIDPIRNAGKLGCILMQFPWSFDYTPENSQYLKKLLPLFREYPIVLEVRHSSWDNAFFYEFLHQENVGFCNVDQPRMRFHLKPGEHATSETGYVRLHGQNIESWLNEEAGRDERYNYLYSMTELEPWIKRIITISRETKNTYVIANNHFHGKAAVNALQIKHLLDGAKVQAPENLQGTYPELRTIAANPTPEQETLF